MKKQASIAILIIVFILLSAGFFYAGMKYSGSKSLANGQRFQQMGLRNGTGATQNRGGGFTMGDVIAKDDKSVTVKLVNGGSKIVFLSPTTQISKSTAGTPDDLQVGSTVSVSGTSNQDGSMTAQTIQLRPSSGANNPIGATQNKPVQ